ncbi:alpha/beta hydrolase family protein [Sphingomonas sp. CJ20]
MDGGDVSDVLAMLDLVDRLPGADPRRIGMWGVSRGGFVTYGTLARTDRIAAAAIIAGPTDLVNARRRAEFDRFIYSHVIRDYSNDKAGALARLSPLRWAQRLSSKTPVLLLHGGDDPRVEPGDTLRMAQALQQLQRPYRMKLYEGGTHDLIGDWADVRQEMDRWLDRYVRDHVTAPLNGVTALSAEETGME